MDGYKLATTLVTNVKMLLVVNVRRVLSILETMLLC